MLKLDNNRKTLYQWDVGVVGTLTIDGVDEVHFSNLRYGVSFNIKVVDNKVEFPPEVLQSGADVFCWAFVREENGGYTKKEQVFNVEKRPRPADYVYEPTEVLSWETLKKEIEKLDEDTTEALADLGKNTIKAVRDVNLWELETGYYYVTGNVFYGTPAPPTAPNTISLRGNVALLFVNIDVANNQTRNFCLFAKGCIYFGSSSFFGFKATGNYTSVSANIGNVITADNLDELATTGAVYNFGDTIKTELQAEIEAIKVEIQGDLDTVSALVGGAE